MKDKITLQSLIEDIANKTGNPEKYTEQFLKEFTATIEEGLLQDGQVNVKGLGTFRLKWVKERTTKNAQTGESMIIPAHSRVVFKPEKPLREYVNRKYARRKPVVFENGQRKKSKSPTKLSIAAAIAVFSLSAVLAYFWFNKHDN